MSDLTKNRAKVQRQLLPRHPSDRVVLGLIGAGLAAATVARVDLAYALVPGGIAVIVQKVGGHVRAWRSTGVERVFVMESSAISFYVVLGLLAIVGCLDAAGAHVPMGWVFFTALMVETFVRQVRSARYA